MKAPPKKGREILPAHGSCHAEAGCLNESPSKKEGKLSGIWGGESVEGDGASMKAPPNRKGTWVLPGGGDSHVAASMKSLPKRKGKHTGYRRHSVAVAAPQ